MGKIIGFFMIIIAGLYLGLYLSEKMKKRIELLAEIIIIVDIIDNHTIYAKERYEECFKYLSGKNFKHCAQWIKSINKDLSEKKDISFEEIWRVNLQYLSQAGLKRDELIIIEDYGRNITTCDRNMLMKMHDNYKNKIKYIYEKLQCEFENKSSVYKSLCVMAGVLVAIILI